jgi:peptidoglycan-associated lipoprotein
MKYVKLIAVLVFAAGLGACSSVDKKTDGAGGKGGSGAGSGSRPAASSSWSDYTSKTKNGYSDRVFFSYDRHDLNAEARQTIEAWSRWLRAHPDATILVEGHTDERGTREYNLALGARRATAVKNYLTALGTSGRRLRTISYGKERPSVAGSTERSWSENRRGVARPNKRMADKWSTTA